jgi:TRAP-type C4-dicarboxylate transport system substrate-binding protein
MLVALAVVSKVWIDKLPPDLRKMVIDVGHETEARAHKWEQNFSKSLEKTWVEMGGQMHLLPPAELAKMRTLLASVGDDVSKDQPEVLATLKRVRDVAAKH